MLLYGYQLIMFVFINVIYNFLDILYIILYNISLRSMKKLRHNQRLGSKVSRWLPRLQKDVSHREREISRIKLFISDNCSRGTKK